jgi:hypothetical protein
MKWLGHCFATGFLFIARTVMAQDLPSLPPTIVQALQELESEPEQEGTENGNDND